MDRLFFYNQIDFQFKIHSVCGLLGPRQVGKTTLAKKYAQKYAKVHFFDLENPLDLARLENPMLALRDLQYVIVVYYMHFWVFRMRNNCNYIPNLGQIGKDLL